jgi:hypothetical protein
MWFPVLDPRWRPYPDRDLNEGCFPTSFELPLNSAAFKQ